MSRVTVDGATLTVYTAAEAAIVMRTQRVKIDAACQSGALRAVDQTPDSSRRSWRIRQDRLVEWDDAGQPVTPPDS